MIWLWIPVAFSFLRLGSPYKGALPTARSRSAWRQQGAWDHIKRTQHPTSHWVLQATTQESPEQNDVGVASKLRTQAKAFQWEQEFTINVGIIAGIGLLVAYALLTVDSDISRGWTAGEVLLRLPVDNWLGYMGNLRANPVMVKAITSGTVYAIGDFTAQLAEGLSLGEIDRLRIGRSSIAGFIGHGPLSHYWYELCEGLFSWLQWNDMWWVTAPKIVVDQLCWGPCWNGIYIALLGFMKRDSFEKITEAVKSTGLPLILSGLKLWGPAHVVTYGLIPVENRLLWVDMVEILWVVILSKAGADQADMQIVEEAIVVDDESTSSVMSSMDLPTTSPLSEADGVEPQVLEASEASEAS
ncbi:unnamed protein product [Chrysoparadoxa australica]